MMQTRSPAPPAPPAPSSPVLARLAGLLAAHAPHDGSFETAIPGVHAIRAEQASFDLVHGLFQPALCIVAQGAKMVMLGNQTFKYDPSRMLIFSSELPLAAMIREASVAAPYLSFRLDFDLARLSVLIGQVYPDGVPLLADQRPVYVTGASDEIIDAAARLLALAARPDDAALLAPLITDEIMIRMLRSPMGGRLAQLGRSESHRVGKAIAWLRDHFAQPIRVGELAELAHMSPSSLHEHFKSFTSLSPLQYQKTLRLQEARRLMLLRGISANVASRRVGYVSASQFSREYARHFGNTPSGDLARQRLGEAG